MKSYTEDLPGKHKFLGDLGAAVTPCDAMNKPILISFICSTDNTTSFTYYNRKASKVFAAKFSDAEFTELKEQSGVLFPFAAVYKSIATETSKGRAQVVPGPQEVKVTFRITSVKNKTTDYLFTVTLCLCPCSNTVLAANVISPLSRMIQQRRLAMDEADAKTAILDREKRRLEGSLAIRAQAIEALRPSLPPLREKASSHYKAMTESATKILYLQRKLQRFDRVEGKNTLDVAYAEGGALPFMHIPNAEEHTPAMHDFENDELADYLHDFFPPPVILKNDAEEPSPVARKPATPISPPITMAMSVFRKIDDWDFSVFDLEAATNGNALFYVAYSLLHKLDLVRHFGIDDATLRRFLAAVQAGYHPNPYHNSTHAADVAHINYYILTKGGLSEKLKLSRAQLLGAVLAGIIHDYDHPGFNNNFHVKTNAHLATLYNDRSVLENHHLACVFEMLRRPKYNIFAPLTNVQCREIRETMVEMVLATDMGLHSKVFSAFRNRMRDNPNWSEKKDDIHLALAMSVKMADVSNCGRPRHLYLEWAKKIATEFYMQGDAEEKLCLSISPFMDRRKGRTDFPKGQISFMTFIVVPMFESIAELLPPVELALQYCTENKEYWQNQE